METVVTNDTSRQTLTDLVESTYVRVIVSDKSDDACEGIDTAVYLLHIANIKLSLQLELAQDYHCSPYYSGTLSVHNSGTDLAEQVIARLDLPEGVSLTATGSADINLGNIAAGETASATIQVVSDLLPMTATELIAKAQIWSCLQGDSVPTVVYGDWDWTGTPRQVDEDTAIIRVQSIIPADVYDLSVQNSAVCYGQNAELTASSNLSGTQYFNWYEDASFDHYLGTVVVNNPGESAVFTIPNITDRTTFYVAVGTDESCPAANNLRPQSVSLKRPLGNEVITVTDDAVCYDEAAALTASSDIGYPQHFTWWDKTQTTILKNETIESGVSHFNPEHQISDSIYFVSVYNDTTCPYVQGVYNEKILFPSSETSSKRTIFLLFFITLSNLL